MKNRICQKPHCENTEFSSRLYNGQQFCKVHYKEIFVAELNSHYTAWDGITKPSERLKYLVGRYYDEHETALIGEPSMTKEIVHRRSYDWKKAEDKVFFTSVIFPIDKELGEPYVNEVHQTWEFNPKTLKFTRKAVMF
jgi:hypothetical protein